VLLVCFMSGQPATSITVDASPVHDEPVSITISGCCSADHKGVAVPAKYRPAHPQIERNALTLADVLANSYDVHRLIVRTGLQLEPAFNAGLTAAWTSDFQSVTSSAAAAAGLGSAIRGIRAHGASFAPALGAVALHQQGGSVGLGSSGQTEGLASDGGAHDPESASAAAQRSSALLATLRIGATAGSALLADVADATSDAFDISAPALPTPAALLTSSASAASASASLANSSSSDGATALLEASASGTAAEVATAGAGASHCADVVVPVLPPNATDAQLVAYTNACIDMLRPQADKRISPRDLAQAIYPFPTTFAPITFVLGRERLGRVLNARRVQAAGGATAAVDSLRALEELRDAGWADLESSMGSDEPLHCTHASESVWRVCTTPMHAARDPTHGSMLVARGLSRGGR